MKVLAHAEEHGVLGRPNFRRGRDGATMRSRGLGVGEQSLSILMRHVRKKVAAAYD